jgi:hypothetical protein
VHLERRSDGQWRWVGTRRLSDTGEFSFSIDPATGGRKLYRVRKPADDDHIAVHRQVTITVV